jgi:hypothetical protein
VIIQVDRLKAEDCKENLVDHKKSYDTVTMMVLNYMKLALYDEWFPSAFSPQP